MFAKIIKYKVGEHFGEHRQILINLNMINIT